MATAKRDLISDILDHNIHMITLTYSFLRTNGPRYWPHLLFVGEQTWENRQITME